jgi:hypothetical protein
MSIKKKDYLRVRIRRINQDPYESRFEDCGAYTVTVDLDGNLNIHGADGGAGGWDQVTVKREGMP